MVLRVKLNGSGVQGDPYRVSLPTYGHLHGNITQRVAFVSIAPEHVFPDGHDLDHEKVEETTEGPFYPSLCDACIAAAHDHMDTKYAEHKGKFRIVQA